jgi:hypothetical protein
MPGTVRSPADEKLWKKAKQAATDQYGFEKPSKDRFYAVVQTIYKNMKANASTATAEIEQFMDQYIETALQTSMDDNGKPMDRTFGPDAIDPETKKAMLRDCSRFTRENKKLLDGSGMDESDQAHNFWLSRNGHGSGFWDRGLGPLGDELHKVAKRFGEYDLYVGDDGYIHGTGGRAPAARVPEVAGLLGAARVEAGVVQIGTQNDDEARQVARALRAAGFQDIKVGQPEAWSPGPVVSGELKPAGMMAWLRRLVNKVKPAPAEQQAALSLAAHVIDQMGRTP